MEEENTQPETKQPSNVQALSDAVKQLTEQNERMENNLKEAAELQAHKLISGTSDLPEQPTPPKEETAKEYKDRVLAGGLNE